MLLESALASLATLALSAVLFESRRKRQEAHMTAEVRERYDAYVEMEQRVRDALGEFDRQERGFQSEMAKSRDQLEHLQQALDQLEGIESGEGDTPGGFLGVFDEGDANVQAHPVTAHASDADLEAELAEWQRKVEYEQNEKRVEIERQRSQVSELTERVRQLEPHAAALRQREQELAEARKRIAELERVRAPETAPSTGPLACAAAAGGIEDELARAGEYASGLASALAQLAQSSAEQLAGLRRSLGNCTPLLEEASRAGEQRVELEQHNQELERSCATLEERCRGIEEELRACRAELEREREVAGEARRRLEAAQEELAGLHHSLELESQHLAREQRTLAELQDSKKGLESQLASSLGSLEASRRECLDLRSQSSEQAELLENRSEALREREGELERLRTRVHGLEERLCNTRSTIGGQKTRLVELMEAIDVAQQEQHRHKALLSEQSAHIQEARSLLEELRPVMDALEDQLERQPSGESAPG